MTLLQSMFIWLLTPISGSLVHDINEAVSWHGRLMVMGWGILLPLGVMMARFFKVTPKQAWPKQLDNKLWWHIHLASQSIGLLMVAIGLWLVFNIRTAVTDSPLALWHGYAGWSVIVLGLIQVLGGIFRGSKGGPASAVSGNVRGDHYDMTLHRRMFEMVHKTCGYLALCLAVCVIAFGLVLSDAPRWMPAGLAIWYLSLAAVFVLFQKQGRCFDTYQAIWGDGFEHPGNVELGAGWGSKRYSVESFKNDFCKK